MSTFSKFAELRSEAGTSTTLGYDFGTLFEGLAKRGEADVAIVSTEDGFSPLGGSSRFFEEDLGVSYAEEIRPLADWNRFENDCVTLIAIPTRNPEGYLRGLILAPGNNTESYKRYANSSYGRPHRTYYYNVTYEAIAFASASWGARKLAVSHLSECGDFHEDIATCQAEALAHFCDSNPLSAPQSLVFCGCCIRLNHLRGIDRLKTESGKTKHIPIRLEVEIKAEGTLLHLDWS